MLTESPFLYFVHLDIDPDHEEVFNQRYGSEHIPAMLTVPGVTSAARYATSDPGVQRYLAVYRFEQPGLYQTDAWRAGSGTGKWPHLVRPYFRNHVFAEYQATGVTAANASRDASYIFVVRLDVDPEHEDAFNRVYNSEHFPFVMKTPGMVRGARFHTTGDTGVPRYMTVFEMDNPDVPSTKEFRSNADYGDWPEKVRPHTLNTTRAVYKTIGDWSA